MTATELIPWDDMKVAFSCEDGQAFDDWWDNLAPRGQNRALPKGWSYNERDESGARGVLVFRIKGWPLESDGLRVRKLIDRIDTKAAKQMSSHGRAARARGRHR